MSAHPTPTPVVKEVWAPEELLEATRRGVEIWRPVVGTDGRYEVSNLGQGRTWAKKGSADGHMAEPKLLACSLNTDGYRLLQIYSHGKRRVIPLHDAICESFIGPRPGPAAFWQGGHHDDERLNNLLTNVRWCTAAVNMADQKRNGRQGKALRESREIGGVVHWRCSGCKEWKPADQFRAISVPSSLCRLASRCKPCAAARESELRRLRRVA